MTTYYNKTSSCWSNMRTGLLSLCLLLSLSACVQVASVRPMLPPEALTVQTPEPQFTGSTNGDLLEHIRKLEAALQECNDDKSALRLWRKEQ